MLKIRKEMEELAQKTGNGDFIHALNRFLYRPVNELYIPIPDSKKFHMAHPDFFAPGAGLFQKGSAKLLLPKEKRGFDLVFEPSGDSIRAYITQDGGKAIESEGKQSYLGEWLLRGVFQLKPYEPLTKKRLEELGYSAMQLYKVRGSNAVHIKFISLEDNGKQEEE